MVRFSFSTYPDLTQRHQHPSESFLERWVRMTVGHDRDVSASIRRIGEQRIVRQRQVHEQS